MTAYKSPEIHRTPLYRAKAAYNGMLARCLNRNGKNPAYANVELRMTLAEWLEWALPEYRKFQDKFPDAVPNAARIGDSGHYEIDNVRVVSRAENCAETRKLGARPDGLKLCSRCQTPKPVEEFNKNKSRWDGLATDCKSCIRECHEIRKKKVSDV